MAYGQIYVDPSRMQNAFTQGLQTREFMDQRANRQALGDAFAQGGFGQAAKVAGGQGNMQLAAQLQGIMAQADEGQRAQIAQRVEEGVRFAYALRMAPMEQRAALYAGRAAALGLPPQPDPAALSDEALEFDIRQGLPILEQVKAQSTKVEGFGDTMVATRTDDLTRRASVTPLVQRGPTIQENISQQNANTSADRLALDREKLGLDREKFAAEQAGASGQQAAASPAQIQTLETVIGNIERMLPASQAEGRQQGDLYDAMRANFGFMRGASGAFTFAGTDKAAADALLNQVAGGLTLEQAAALKGVLSDRDMQLLERSASRLSNRKISDAEAEAELLQIRQFFAAKLQEATGGTAPRPAGGQRLRYNPETGRLE